ncbi:YuzL family protein [Ectobacillus antri]|jgi:hypothetical protein|uniref:YuzL family protein n=1 Tax=Ectobacillus antri TaxID=2486280 RepID=A0ABT6H7Y8_9BACI|nr:YuzL family protein [Ectobacillus antri]MDG4657112.1 YuzL family protein [Ectobacillus antri]MDG5754571.1 YuzL family protein [Ectobacillus antri]
MGKQKKNPSKGAVSAASARGNADSNQLPQKGRHGNNEQYGKQNMSEG